MPYAELCVTSNFSFLTGASHPEELVARAAELGLDAIAITDNNSLAGVVRAWAALREMAKNPVPKKAPRINGKDVVQHAIRIRSQVRIDPTSRQDVGLKTGIEAPRVDRLPKLIVGSRLILKDSSVHWVALPTDRPAYARLSRLLTLGKRRAEKGQCILGLSDVLEGAKGIILIGLPQGRLAEARGDLLKMAKLFPGHVFLGATPRYDGRDKARFGRLARLALETATPMVAVGNVLMHHGKRRQLADVLTCLREHLTIDEIGARALPNAERRLKGFDEMAQVFRDHPAALRRTIEITNRCTFCLSELSFSLCKFV